MAHPNTRRPLDQGLFTRETKFLIAASDAVHVRAWARRFLTPDPHGTGPHHDEYATTTLYFDTPAFDVFHRHGSFGRGKFRVRRYGAMDAVFLERKLRTDGLLVKRRVTIPAGELSRFVAAPAAGWPGHWFHKRVVARGLQPVCQVSYSRMARQGSDGAAPMRLTLDDDLRARLNTRVAIAPIGGVAFLRDQAILELKYVGDMPSRFQELIDRLDIAAESVSKYRLGAAALGCVTKRDTDVVSTTSHDDAAHSPTGETL